MPLRQARRAAYRRLLRENRDAPSWTRPKLFDELKTRFSAQFGRLKNEEHFINRVLPDLKSKEDDEDIM